jgi:hypothetical protein
MKFELTADTLLKVSGAAALVYGASAVAAPRNYHDLFHTAVSVINQWAPVPGGIGAASGCATPAGRPPRSSGCSTQPAGRRERLGSEFATWARVQARTAAPRRCRFHRPPHPPPFNPHPRTNPHTTWPPGLPACLLACRPQSLRSPACALEACWEAGWAPSSWCCLPATIARWVRLGVGPAARLPACQPNAALHTIRQQPLH